MAENKNGGWRIDRRLGISTVVQLVLLAGLIIGSWVNLQRQLALLQRDVAELVETCKGSDEQIEDVKNRYMSHEYRIRVIEQKVSDSDKHRFSK